MLRLLRQASSMSQRSYANNAAQHGAGIHILAAFSPVTFVDGLKGFMPRENSKEVPERVANAGTVHPEHPEAGKPVE